MKTFIRFGLASAAMLAAGLSNGYAKDDVKVSEVMPCNISTYMVNLNYTGWLELQNIAGSSVDINGYKIDHYKINKNNEAVYEWTWAIGERTEISKDGFTVICFDGSDMDSKNSRKLDSKGGVVVVKNQSGEVVDSFKYLPTQTHISYGIYEGVEGYMEPTPGKANKESYSSLNYRCAMPYFDGAQPGVQQNGSVTVRIKTKTQGCTIYYTKDGSEPTKSSKVYDANSGISIGTTNAVIRARAYKDGMISSPILTGSFIFMDAAHSKCGSGFKLPIVSIVTDNANFYDGKIGIYTTGDGTNGQYAETSCLPDEKLNYIMDWTRPGNFEYIVNNNDVVNHEVDLAVMGGCSRKYEVKSLKIKAGNRMGSGNTKLDYDFFADKIGNEYKSLQLRNGGNGHEERYLRFRDGFMQSIAKPMNIDYQAYQPVAYYINGVYKGLMGLRERTNKAYVESNYGLDESKLDVLEITNKHGVVATCGDREAYDQLVSFLENNDPKSDDYYEKAAKMMDMDEYLDYQIFQQFIVNTDWPGNNTKVWRNRDNGRFRWITFDTDFGLGLYGEGGNNNCADNANMINWASGKGSRYNWANGTNEGFTEDTKWKTTIFSHLIQNPTFKERFINKYLLHLTTTFKYDKIVAKLDSIVELVGDEFCATFDGARAENKDAYYGMLKFAKNRPSTIYENLMAITNYKSYVTMDVKSSVKGAHIMMNNELMPSSSMSMKYFQGKQMKLEAIAPAGYKFVGWKSGEDKSVSQEPSNNEINPSKLNYTNTRTWKYFTSAEGISVKDWRRLDSQIETPFDDSEWLSGSGKMGYKDGDHSIYDTEISGGDKGDHYATTYFRSKFEIDDLSAIDAIVARITFDDGFALYVNGSRISTANLPSFEPDAYTNQYVNDSVVTVIIPKENLLEGTNLFAVEVHQCSQESSDMTLMFEESIVYNASASTTTSSEYLSTKPILTVTPSSDMILKAVFEKVDDCTTPDIIINEICASNSSKGGTSDEYGNYPDWFEVYNATSDTINMAGMYLTDNKNKETKYMIPFGYEQTKIAPRGRLVFWADGMPYMGPLHIGFKLQNVDNASLGLNMDCGTDIVSVDYVDYMELASNKSYGHDADGSGNWVVFGDCDNGKVYLPTPGTANSSYICKSDECFVTSVEEHELSEAINAELVIYPIPTEDVVNVKVKNADQMNIFIYDNLGRLLDRQETTSASAVVNLIDYPSGIYHFEIMANGEVYKQAVIKK